MPKRRRSAIVVTKTYDLRSRIVEEDKNSATLGHSSVDLSGQPVKSHNDETSLTVAPSSSGILDHNNNYCSNAKETRKSQDFVINRKVKREIFEVDPLIGSPHSKPLTGTFNFTCPLPVISKSDSNVCDISQSINKVPKQAKKRNRKQRSSASSSICEEKVEIKVESDELRRSQRKRYPRLEGWRNQRLNYSYKNGVIDDVELLEGDEPDYKSFNKIRRTQEYQELRKQIKKKVKFEEYSTRVAVVNGGGREFVYLHRPHETLLWAVAGHQCYSTAKTFPGRLISFGYVNIGIMKEKHSIPNQNVVYNVVKGNNIRMRINEACFRLKELDSFVVPAGNAYSIYNEGNADALLHFSSFDAPIFDYQYKNMNKYTKIK